MSSTLVQGDKVTAHNTSHPAGPLHLEWEECDLLRCICTQLSDALGCHISFNQHANGRLQARSAFTFELHINTLH